MDENLKSTLKIHGGVTPYGTVTLSGDSDAAIFHMVQAFFNENKVTLENIPRSGIVLDFISLLSQLGVELNWNNETTLSVLIPAEVSHDLTRDNIPYKFVQILTPALLFRKGVCDVPGTFREKAKFYRQLGFDIDIEGNVTSIHRNFIKQNEAKINIDVTEDEVFMAASRIFLSYFVPNVNVSYNKNDYRLKSIENMDSSANIRVPYNQFEFNLFAAMASLSASEVTIENFDLSQSLHFLMLFDEIAGNYEVVDSRLKIWRHQKGLNEFYEFLNLSCDVAGYLFLILTLISEKPINIICKNIKELESIVTELNIMGCKISYLDGTDTVVVTIKPVSSLSAVKSEIIDSEWGGVLIFGAIASRSYSRIGNFNAFAYKIQYLLDNFQNLNLDINI
jgi:UDP-N-acetylglucosamine enolpyruvyl transferase